MTASAAATAQESDLASAFARIATLCAEQQLAVPDVAAFHLATFPSDSRVGLFATPGSPVAELFEALTGVRPDENDLHSSIPEAARDTLLFSAALYGTVYSAATGAEGWIERVAFPVVVTPAAAVLGKWEVDLMTTLAGQRRPFAVVVLGLDGGDPAGLIDEIERYKLAPLRRDLGEFPAVMAASTAAAAAELRRRIEPRIGSAKARLLVRVAGAWLAEIERAVAAGIASDRARAARFARVETHLAEHTAALNDSASHETVAAINRLHRCFDVLQEACTDAAREFAARVARPGGAWSEALAPLRRAWDALDDALGAAPIDLARRLQARISGQCTEFCRAYADVVEPPTPGSMTISVPENARERPIASSYPRVEQLTRDDTSRVGTNVEQELAAALLAVIAAEVRPIFLRTAAALHDDVAPALAAEVQRVVLAFQRHVTASVEQARAALRWDGAQRAVRALREEWSRLDDGVEGIT